MRFAAARLFFFLLSCIGSFLKCKAGVARTVEMMSASILSVWTGDEQGIVLRRCRPGEWHTVVWLCIFCHNGHLPRLFVDRNPVTFGSFAPCIIGMLAVT